MKDKTKDEAEVATGEDASQEDSPTTDKAPEEVEESELETEATAEEEEEEEATETEEKVQKKGYTQRVRELAGEKNELKEQVKSLEETIAELTGSVEPQAQMPTYNPQFPDLQPGSEISPEQYKQDLLRTADAMVSLRVKQSEAINRINNEAAEVIRVYSELDPESENFNEELSETVTEATESYIKANPYNASVKNFVARLMKPYQGAVTKEVGKATEQIAKQVSEAALKPTSIRKGEKTAADMTPKELEQKLGIVNS